MHASRGGLSSLIADETDRRTPLVAHRPRRWPEYAEVVELRPRPEQRATRKRPTVESPRKSVAPRAVEVLTDQDAQIAELAGQGWPNRRIAAELDIPPRTVATRLYQVFFRLGVTTRSQLTTAMLGDGR